MRSARGIWRLADNGRRTRAAVGLQIHSSFPIMLSCLPRRPVRHIGSWVIVAAIGLCTVEWVLASPDTNWHKPDYSLAWPGSAGAVALRSGPAPAEVRQPVLLAQQSPAAGSLVDADPAQPQAPLPAAGETGGGDASARRPALSWARDSLPRRDAEGEVDEGRVRALIGVAANTSPNFFGGDSQRFKLKPVVALERGRWRLSTGGGYGLMGQGRRDRGSGAQAMLRATDRFNLSLSLNIDRGRDVADTDRLKGVPDVRATLRARLRARYNLTERWTASLAASQDILGRGRGMEVDGWLGYRWPISAATRLDVGLGASWGNSQYMRSQFGVPQSAAATSGYPAFKPRGGLYQTELGVDVAHALSRHWVLFGGVRYSQLHGDARRSPLTLRSSGLSATAGVAWRN